MNQEIKKIFEEWDEMDEVKRPKIVSNIFKMQMKLRKLGLLERHKTIPNHTLNTIEINKLRYIEVKLCDELMNVAENNDVDLWTLETVEELIDLCA
jgi:hypothetical protein